jgi:peptide/nickel transport system permease protein
MSDENFSESHALGVIGVGSDLLVTTKSSGFRKFTVYVRSNRGLIVGLVIVGISIFLMLFGPYIGPYGPNSIDFNAILVGPSRAHWLGTDENGRDVLSRLLAAPREDVYIAVVSTMFALAIGVPLGVLATATGRISSLFGEWLMRLMDVVQAFPVFILALALVAAFGPSTFDIVIVLTVIQFPVFLRLTRSVAIPVRGLAFVQASRLGGASPLNILRRHVLPNSIGPAIVGASVAVAQAILITAGLSFVGAGIRPPTAEWGQMISDGAQTLVTGQWWVSVFAGIMLGVTVLGYALVGDGLRNFFDPVGGS